MRVHQYSFKISFARPIRIMSEFLEHGFSIGKADEASALPLLEFLQKGLSVMAADNYFLGRQPIFDGERRIAGFELLFRASNVPYAEISDYSMASASVILNTLTEFGIGRILGRHRGFFNVDRELLMSDTLELLPRDQVVIELLETIEVTDSVVERCRELRKKNFVLALDDNIYSEASIPLYETVDIVKVDIQQVSAAELSGMAACLRNWPVGLLAEKIETPEQYALCRDIGFEFYQGYYFERPSVLHQKRLDDSRIALMDLFNKISAEADIKTLEESFKKSPTLAYSLLRLVNSVAFGLREKISSLRHALMVLGVRQLRRWVTLALFACTEKGTAASPMLEVAVTRGRLMEILVAGHGQGAGEDDFPERAFIVGLLSLADIIFETSMEEILGHLNLTDDVRMALAFRKGILGELLCLAEKVERSEWSALPGPLEKFGLTPEVLLDAQIRSIDWANNLHEIF